MPTASRDLIQLADVPYALFKLAGEERPPTYIQIWTALRDGKLGDVAVKVGERLFVDRADLPKIAAHFRLKQVKPEAPKPVLRGRLPKSARRYAAHE